MKRFFNILSILLILLIPSVLFAQEVKEQPPMRIMSGQTIIAGGTSTFMINLRNPGYNFPVKGDFSIQFANMSTATSGATVNAAYRISNVFPEATGGISEGFEGILTGSSEITSSLESVDILSDVSVTSGNTDYLWGFWPVDITRILIIDITAGGYNITTDVYFSSN